MPRRNDSTPPHDGKAAQTLVVARIRGCSKQKELSLDDQCDHLKEFVAELHDGPVEYDIIATKGKGERLDRPELYPAQPAMRPLPISGLVVECDSRQSWRS